jgi:hypothetical protein
MDWGNSSKEGKYTFWIWRQWNLAIEHYRNANKTHALSRWRFQLTKVKTAPWITTHDVVRAQVWLLSPVIDRVPKVTQTLDAQKETNSIKIPSWDSNDRKQPHYIPNFLTSFLKLNWIVHLWNPAITWWSHFISHT